MTRVMALPATDRENSFKSVSPYTPIANVAVPETLVVTLPDIVKLTPSDKATSTPVLAAKPVMVKLRMAFAGCKAKPVPEV